jgi:peroxiredoxin
VKQKWDDIAPLFRAARRSDMNHQRHLLVGDIAPDFVLRAPDGKEVNLRSDAIAGNPIVILFCPPPPSESLEGLRCFEQHLESLRGHGARLFAVTSEELDSRSTQVLNFPVLADNNRQIFGSFGVSRHRFSCIVLRRNHHVAGNFEGEPEAQVAAVVSLLESMEGERKTVLMQAHPPVLLIPDALSRDDCTRLIEKFETTGHVFVEPQAATDFFKGSDYKMRIPEHMREDRIDHFFFEKDIVALLQNRLGRIAPEIFKAFQYRVTKYEALRMACYRGHRGGFSHGHRDNIAPYRYRRFALSINLNTEEFEGGELRFPEFGDQRYRPETGTAIVFSSSLLHEAMHVTSGRRFVFLAFLFGDT